MPSSYLQGIQSSFDNQAQIVNDIYVVTSNWFVNRCPIVARTPRVPVGSVSFQMVSRGFRPGSPPSPPPSPLATTRLPWSMPAPS